MRPKRRAKKPGLGVGVDGGAWVCGWLYARGAGCAAGWVAAGSVYCALFA